MFGVLKDMSTSERLRGVAVEAVDMKWGRHAAAFANDSGKYEMNLGRNGEWLVSYSASGYLTKRIKLVLTGPAPEDWIGGFGMNVDMALMKPKSGVDYAALDEPFGICRYNGESGNFEWDMAYTQKMRDLQADLLKAHAEP